MATEPPRVALIVNPVARPAAHARLLDRLRRTIPHLSVAWTTIDEPGTTQAAQAVTEGAELVVAAGGDGTIRSVAVGVAGTGVPLGVIPLGTANVLARNLKLPMTLDGHLRTLLTGVDRPVDLGRVSLGIGNDGWTDETGFVVLAGVGHDAATIADTDRAVKRRYGWWSYLMRGSRRLADQPLPMRVTIDGQSEDTEAWSVLIGNFPGIPTGIQVFPGARPDDGLLDVLQARIRHPAQWVPVVVSGIARRPVRGAGLVRSRAREVVVTMPTATGVQLDGDAVGQATRVRFRVEPGALLLRVPRRGSHRAAVGSRNTELDVENA